MDLKEMNLQQVEERLTALTSRCGLLLVADVEKPPGKKTTA